MANAPSRRSPSHRSPRWALALPLAAALWAAPAWADVRLNLGGDYWLDPESGLFNLTLQVDTPLARRLSVGARFGALVVTDDNDNDNTVGVPLDLVLRARFARSPVYVEGLVGPWILFDTDDALRAHAAFGFGLQGPTVALGLEVGYLESSAMLGLRLGFRF